jgi:hypothetical protein
LTSKTPEKQGVIICLTAQLGAALEMLYTGGRIDAQKVPVLLPKNVHQTGKLNSHRFSVLG